MNELFELPAAETARKVATGELSAVDTVSAALKRGDDPGESLKAFAHVDTRSVLAAALKGERPMDRRPD